MSSESLTIEIEPIKANTNGNGVSSDSSESTGDFQNAQNCCENLQEMELGQAIKKVEQTSSMNQVDGRRRTGRVATEQGASYAANKNVAEGMMDIALLSANANQLRFLITYNSASSTYYISLGLIVLSLAMQVSVGIALIFKHRTKRCNGKRFARTNEFLVGGVFMVTVVNILLAAFTTTDVRR